MIEINRNQILEIKVHQEQKDASSIRIAAFIDGPKQILMSFIDGPIEFEKPVYFMGCEFMVTAFKDVEGNEINYTYHAESTGDCSVIEDFLKSVRPEKKIVKKHGKAVENIGDGKTNMNIAHGSENVFDTKTELGLLKARVSALETALQRVPYAKSTESYEDDFILNLTTVNSIAFCNEQPGRGDYIEIGFSHKRVNLKRVIYKGTLLEVTDGRCNGNEELCRYVAASVGPISPELMQEAKDQPILAGSYYQCENPQCMVWSRHNVNGPTKCSHCGTIQKDK